MENAPTNDSCESKHARTGLQRALRAARERGSRRTADILSQASMLDAGAMAGLLGRSLREVDESRRRGELLGLADVAGSYLYPRWQLSRDGQPYPELPKLLAELGSSWAVYRLLLQEHPALNGVSGLSALERGRSGAVLGLAESVARGEFT